MITFLRVAALPFAFALALGWIWFAAMFLSYLPASTGRTLLALFVVCIPASLSFWGVLGAVFTITEWYEDR
jgi:hypothetical protein